MVTAVITSYFLQFKYQIKFLGVRGQSHGILIFLLVSRRNVKLVLKWKFYYTCNYWASLHTSFVTVVAKSVNASKKRSVLW